MDEQQPKSSMKDNVLEVIGSGKVKMRPRWQFISRAALLIAGIILGVGVTLFLSSLIVFILRQTGVWFVPGFGFHGYGIFFSSLPWILIVLAVVFIILLEILIRKYSFAYGRPFMYSVLGVIVVVTLGGVVIGYSSFHHNLFNRAEHGRLPFGGPLYRQFMQPPGNVTVGTILEITNMGYKIQGHRDQIFVVTITPQTKISENNFNIGDNILVIGERQGNAIQAEEIEKPDHLPPPLHSFH